MRCGSPLSRATAAPAGTAPAAGGRDLAGGREQAIDEVAGLAGRPGVRLVTLTGLAGIGKTRLAVAVAKRLAGRFGAGTTFVPLAPVTQPELVLTGVARAVGAELAGASSPVEPERQRTLRATVQWSVGLLDDCLHGDPGAGEQWSHPAEQGSPIGLGLEACPAGSRHRAA